MLPFYLLSTLRPRQLADWVSLTNEIPGSEKWSVRDLFQRDVDLRRVGNSLLPYLQSEGKIKFFSPLVLTLLPVAKRSGHVGGVIPRLKEWEEDQRDVRWKLLERPHHYRIAWTEESREQAVLEWDDERVRIVAIDGQHRLAAMKRLMQDSTGPAANPAARRFLRWNVPVVIVSFQADVTTSLPRVNDVVRSTFVYINTTARRVSRSREILLSDASVNGICTQELLNHSHQNDCSPPSERQPRRLPLLFFDWRGEEDDGKPVPSPVAVLSVEEIHDWFETYILGKDLSVEQRDALAQVLPDQLHGAFARDRMGGAHSLTYEESDQLRECIRPHFLPAFLHFLQDFTPFARYTAQVRELEKQIRSDANGDLVRRAFDYMRYRTPPPRYARDQVLDEATRLERRLETLRRFPPPLDKDVGVRGIAWAFGHCRRVLGVPEWRRYATWFTKALNAMYADGWLDVTNDVCANHLLHVVRTRTGKTVNYRLRDAGAACGAYVALMVGAYGGLDAAVAQFRAGISGRASRAGGAVKPLDQPSQRVVRAWVRERERLLQRLERTVARGYRSEIRARLKQEPRFAAGGKTLTQEVGRRAAAQAQEHIKRLGKDLARCGGLP